MKLIVSRAVFGSGVDLEAWESALRAAVLAAGAGVLADLLEEVGSGRRRPMPVCECGAVMESRGQRPKQLRTVLGPVNWSRSRYQCPSCGQTRYPGDEELDVGDTGRSPGVRRMMARAGSQSSFQEASEDLRVYAGIEVGAKEVERVAESVGEAASRWSVREGEQAVAESQSGRPPIPIFYVCMDGTGVPMTAREREGRRGKQPDGTARTREVKLGCVFTQTGRDEKGRPRRDPQSTTFIGAIETADAFGWRLYGEARRRGLDRAERVAVLGDGAQWIKGIVDLHFPQAVQIIDLYHAREHVSDLCKLLFEQQRQIHRHRMRWWTDLDEGKIEKIASEARRYNVGQAGSRKEVEGEVAYLERNRERMRYADFRSQGLFVGSGVVEAGCKTVVGQRLKQSGMEWSLRGANAIIALRCVRKSNRFEDYWESRAS